MDLRFVDIPKIENDQLLEDLVKDLFKADPQYTNVNIHGRLGQRQNGVDVFASRSDLTWVGVQCKVRSSNEAFSKNELIQEINKAKKFNPQISDYFLYTTLSRDANTQELEREIKDELSATKSFRFKICFWEDIESKLREEKFQNVYHRYYYKFVRDNRALGHAIGKLVNLQLAFDKKPDARYELIIGKIPPYKTDDHKNVDYYRGTYYIVNLHEQKLEFFSKRQGSNKVQWFASDITRAFSTTIDQYRIAEWLEQIDDIDDFIYDDKHNYEFSVSEKDRENYFREEE